jgi:hypothetical protein
MEPSQGRPESASRLVVGGVGGPHPARVVAGVQRGVRASTADH